MFYLLPLLASLPLVCALGHQQQPIPPNPSRFTRVVRPRDHYSAKRYRPIEKRAETGGGVESVVSDLLGGTGEASGASSQAVESQSVMGTNGETSVASTQTAQAGVTFPTTALATPTSIGSSSTSLVLSTRTASSSIAESSGIVDSNASSSIVAEQTLSTGSGIVSTELLTIPSSGTLSSSTIPSSSSEASTSEATTSSEGSTSTSEEPEPTTTEEAPISTQRAISTAEAVTILSTLSQDDGGVKTIYSTAGDSAPSTTPLKMSGATSSLVVGGQTVVSFALVASITLLYL
ncbi:hypothetical protein JCM16303_005336 [Sporobolomyces ruberrimus]